MMQSSSTCKVFNYGSNSEALAKDDGFPIWASTYVGIVVAIVSRFLVRFCWHYGAVTLKSKTLLSLDEVGNGNDSMDGNSTRVMLFSLFYTSTGLCHSPHE